MMWKLPSPMWPAMVAKRSYFLMMACASAEEFGQVLGGTTKSSMKGAVCLSLTFLRRSWKDLASHHPELLGLGFGRVLFRAVDFVIRPLVESSLWRALATLARTSSTVSPLNSTMRMSLGMPSQQHDAVRDQPDEEPDEGLDGPSILRKYGMKLDRQPQSHIVKGLEGGGLCLSTGLMTSPRRSMS